ncbi:MAG TPA: tyrosine-protein phosphatase [Caulobacteraceae bacterium]|nr:tyrosine-protein phosphatase [Caulobacteraceae bacterium]
MNSFIAARTILGAVFAFLAATGAEALEGAVAERAPSGEIVLRWTDADPVDVYVSARPDAAPAAARLLVRGDRDGLYRARWTRPERPYFMLRDERDGDVVRVAERVVTLERGSNFRDLGGYPAAGGKHVRWGVIYRTAAMPMLTDADYRYVGRLGIRSIIDLRSVEERQLAPDGMPTRTGALYLAHDYPADAIFSRIGAPPPAGGQNPVTGLYRTWLVSLAPQFRDIFQQLLRRDGAVSYHCSAGQDRTGVATALVLSALGVPREVIMADYQLSTLERRPDNEIPKLAPGQYPGNIVADFYRRAQAAGPMKARPLYTAAGKPFLQETFDEIDARWGSVDAYLDQVLGIDKAQIAKLRLLYLE